MSVIENFRVQVYCDGVKDQLDLNHILTSYPFVKGFTTNPSLMRKAGVLYYEMWAKGLLANTKLPISFEVVNGSDIQREAEVISYWGPNVYVKIPIVQPDGTSNADMISFLSHRGIKVNVTAVMTLAQIDEAVAALPSSLDMTSIISVFAGRIADTGLDPAEHIQYAVETSKSGQAILWASPRQIFDVQRADELKCDIITCTPELLSKAHLFGKDLTEYSRETSEMFYRDAKEAGYTL